VSVPFLDLGRLHDSIRPELDAVIDRVISSSAFIGGQEVSRFEEAFAAAHRRQHCVGCASGTDALSLALRALGVGRGDEVVVPSMTFFATAEAVVHAGATPVLADVDPISLLLTPDNVDAVRTDRTRAVMPVHLYGHPVDFSHLRHWRDQGFLVVEDAAQAHLATFGGEFVGTVGDAACFSFFPGKNLGAFGDAGAVVTDDPDLAARVRKLRDHGRTEKYLHDEVGVSSRLDGLQAAILATKLTHLAEWTEHRRTIARAYSEVLTELANVDLVPWPDGAVHHLLVARVPAALRSAIQMGLSRLGIATGIHYPVPLSRQPAMASCDAICPSSDAGATEVLSLPMDPLMSKGDVLVVAEGLARLMDPQ
jgi:dTDP-3-amino-3,4,6-trideoxy-alpha-D-glucose transaminase